jgi:hypothetical protein
MDIILGLGLFGYALMYNDKNTDEKQIRKTNEGIQNYNTHYLNNYTVDFLENNRKIINKKLNIDYNNSLNSNSKIVNDQWRYETSVDKNKKKETENLITKDIGVIKKKKYLTNNIIEPMMNIDNQSDSVFSDDYQSFNYKKNKRCDESDSDNYSNVNIKTIDTQKKFIDDEISNYSDNMSMNTKQLQHKKCNINSMEFDSNTGKKRCQNQFLDQFGQLKFGHNGLPEGFNNVKPVINIFNLILNQKKMGLMVFHQK